MRGGISRQVAQIYREAVAAGIKPKEGTHRSVLKEAIVCWEIDMKHLRREQLF